VHKSNCASSKGGHGRSRGLGSLVAANEADGDGGGARGGMQQ